jgi:hypothetical protein
MKCIDLAIVGAQKAGTTSLKNYLMEHPEIYGHLQTEFAYFRNPSEYEKGWENTCEVYFPDLEKNFSKKLIIKNAGLYDSEDAVRRLHDHNPEMHIVFSVRNPIDRAWSSYTMEVSAGWFKQDFEDIRSSIAKASEGEIDQMYRLFIRLGLYSDHLQTFLNYFPKQQIHVYSFEQLKSRPAEICKSIFEILEVDADFTPEVNRVHNKTAKAKSTWLAEQIMKLRRNHNPVKRFAKKILPQKMFTRIGQGLNEFNKSEKRFEEMPEDIRAELQSFFKPYNEELSRLTGLKTEHWK